MRARACRSSARPESAHLHASPSSGRRDCDNERRRRRHLPAGRRPRLLPVRQRRPALIAAPSLRCRNVHARAGCSSAAEPAGCPLQRAPAHRQRRRTAPVLPLLGARRPAEVSEGRWWWSGRRERMCRFFFSFFFFEAAAGTEQPGA